MGRVDVLALQEESNGDFTTISDGVDDPGGVSYGLYQLSSNVGSAQEFTQWLVDKGYEWGSYLLNSGEPGSQEYSEAWRVICERDPANFENMQIVYGYQTYFTPAAFFARQEGLDVDNYTDALKNALFSASVQHGTGNILDLVKESGKQTGDDEADIIRAFYAVRTGWYPRCTPRYERECEAALAMLGELR